MDKNDLRVKLWAMINDESKKDEFNDIWHQLTGEVSDKPIVHFGSPS